MARLADMEKRLAEKEKPAPAPATPVATNVSTAVSTAPVMDEAEQIQFLAFKANKALEAEIGLAKNFPTDLLMTDGGQDFLTEQGQAFFGGYFPKHIANRIKEAKFPFSSLALRSALQHDPKNTISNFQACLANIPSIPTLKNEFSKYVLDCVADELDDFPDEEHLGLDYQTHPPLNRANSQSFEMEEDEEQDADDDDDEEEVQNDKEWLPSNNKRPLPISASKKTTGRGRGRPKKEEGEVGARGGNPAKRAKSKGSASSQQ